jgi:hypothetical protein
MAKLSIKRKEEKKLTFGLHMLSIKSASLSGHIVTITGKIVENDNEFAVKVVFNTDEDDGEEFQLVAESILEEKVDVGNFDVDSLTGKLVPVVAIQAKGGGGRKTQKANVVAFVRQTQLMAFIEKMEGLTVT